MEGKEPDAFLSVMNAIAFNQTDDYIMNDDNEEGEEEVVEMMDSSVMETKETLVAVPLLEETKKHVTARQREDTHRDVHKWLADIDLGFLAGPLISEGYDTMSRLATLEMEDLIEMGVRRGYARSLLSSLRKDTDQMYKDVRIEIQHLKDAMESVIEARRNCKDAKNRIQIRRKSVRTRIISFFQSLHEILEQRESSLLEDLDECVNEKVRTLSAQQNVLKNSVADLTENLKIAKKTLDEALPQEFAQISLPMLTKLRRMASLNWIDAPLKPLEDGSDIALHVTEQNDDKNEEGIPFIVQELKRTGRILNLSPRCCTLQSLNEEEDNVGGDDAVLVTAGVPCRLILTARDRTRTRLPHGGALVTLQIFENTFNIKSTQQEQLTVCNHTQRVVDRKDGTYDIEFTLTSGSRGNFTLFCVINGGNVEGSPLSLVCDSNVLLVPNSQDANFDSNGLFSFLGTRKGTKTYVNPCDAREVSVEVSSLFNGQVSGVVSSNLSDTYSKDEHGSWYCVDIGPGRLLAPSHYALRNVSRSYAHAPRSWRLEASKDTKKWVLLSEHVNDMSVDTKSGACARFDLNQHVRKDAYRYFCITQTGPNAFGKNVLIMGGFELYGALISEFSSSRVGISKRRALIGRSTTPVRSSGGKKSSSSSKKKQTQRQRPRWNNKFVDVPKIRRCPRVGHWVRQRGGTHVSASKESGSFPRGGGGVAGVLGGGVGVLGGGKN